jgi:nitrogen regulatory protein PII
MKLVKCVVREEKVEETTEALKALNLSGLTISRVSGLGQHEERTELYRGIRYQVRLLPEVMIDVVAPDDLVDDVVRIVSETARTGAVGDGRIFVMTVEEAYSIRTREGGVA